MQPVVEAEPTPPRTLQGPLRESPISPSPYTYTGSLGEEEILAVVLPDGTYSWWWEWPQLPLAPYEIRA